MTDYEYGIAAYERKEFTIAHAHFQEAAKAGIADAQAKLGAMYAAGVGATHDYAESVRWYKLAAAQGLAEANTSLGYRYASGQGVAQDFAESIRWFKLAAEQGEVIAYLNLGVVYTNGQGVARDLVQAYMWWHLAAMVGDRNGLANRQIITREMKGKQVAKAKRLANDFKSQHLSNGK